jgi:hypothetical protein
VPVLVGLCRGFRHLQQVEKSLTPSSQRYF